MDKYLEPNKSQLNEKLIENYTEPSEKLKPLRQTGWRWVALILMNLLLMGDFIAIDNPQPLQTQIQEILKIDDQQYSLLYSVWAFPSIIVPFFGGYLTDKLGVRPASIFFCVALTIGQFIYAFGGYFLDFKMMLIGRAIYAIGSDPLNVAQVVMTNKWFEANEIGFAMSISTATCGLGRAINSYLVPQIFEMTNDLAAPMMFSAYTCLASLVATILMVILDKINDQREIEYAGTGSKNALDEEKMSLKDVRHFKPIAWLLIMSFSLTGGVFFSFNAFANDLYFQSYNFSNTEAGTIISISFIITSVSTTLFGKIVDKYGYRATMIFYSSFLGIFAFMYFLLVPTCDACYSSILPQVFFGFLIGINDAATFPSIPLVLDERYLGTGYGLFYVLQNIFVLIFPPVAAYILDNTGEEDTDSFFWMLLFFSFWMIITILEGFALIVVDKKNKRILDKTVITDEDVNSSIGSLMSQKSDQSQVIAKAKLQVTSSQASSLRSSFKEDSPGLSDK